MKKSYPLDAKLYLPRKFNGIGGRIETILYKKVNHHTKERKHKRGGYDSCFFPQH